MDCEGSINNSYPFKFFYLLNILIIKFNNIFISVIILISIFTSLIKNQIKKTFKHII